MTDRFDRLSRLVSDDDDARGVVLDGRYEIVRRIARGGMGEVFEAVDRKFGRRVAVKAVTERDAGLTVRLAEEARTVARIEDPGIVTIHDAGIFPDGRAYVVMRLVVGRTLAEAMPRKAALIADTCDVVQRAHERGVVHRDLKPANIMVDEAGRVVVLDWGMSALRRAEAPAGGTRGYTAPEQWMGGTVDARSDVYSLGVMLAEATRGDAEMAAIANRAMAMDAAQRYPSAAALAADIRRGLAGEAVTARTGVAYRLRKSLGRSPFLVGLLVFLAVPLLGLLAYRQNDRDRVAGLWARISRTMAEVESLPDRDERLRRELDAIREHSPWDRLLKSRLRRALGERSTDLDFSIPEARFDHAMMLAESEDPPVSPDLEIAEGPFISAADRLAGRAELARARGHLDEAVRLYREAREASPGSAAMMVALARIHWQRGDLVAVVDWTTQALSRRPVAEAHILRARARIGLGADAEADVDAAFRLGGETAGALIARGNLQLKRNEIDAAARSYQRATELEPANPVAWANLGAAKRLLGRSDEAVAAIEEAVRRAPSSPIARTNRGMMRLGRGDVAGAIEDFDVAGTPAALGGRAMAKFRKGDFAGAEDDAAHALRREPRNLAGRLVLAELALRRNDPAAAEVEAGAALECDPRAAEAWAVRATARHALRRFREAEADCTESLRWNPKAAPVWVRRGMCRAAQGRWAEAIADYTEALAVDPTNNPALANRGFGRMMTGDLPGALADCNACIEANAADVEMLHHRAIVRLRMGEAEAGMRDLDEVLRLKPDWSEVRARRALLHNSLGNAEKARNDAREALRGELHPDLQAELRRILGE